MKATIEGYTFDFPNATSISKFDGPTHRMSQAMKAVDVVIELPDLRLYVEVKDLEAFKENLKDKSKAEKKEALTKLRCDLAYKYRDSLLYHWCQEMPEKKLGFYSLPIGKLRYSIISKVRLLQDFPLYRRQRGLEHPGQEAL